MDQSRRSPAIIHLSWGRMEMDGYAPFKDAKVYPGGAREWDWRETETHHVPFARRPSSVHFGHPVPEMHSVSPRLIPFAATVLRSSTLRRYRSRVPSLNDFTPSI